MPADLIPKTSPRVWRTHSRLDETPAEQVQLVGYLESVSSGLILDLITVSAYELGSEQILVPQRSLRPVELCR
jgi:hypothetical protein